MTVSDGKKTFKNRSMFGEVLDKSIGCLLFY